MMRVVFGIIIGLFISTMVMAGQRVSFNKETVFSAGKYKVYALKADFNIDQKGKKVKMLKLRIRAYRAGLFHLIKAGVIRTMGMAKLLKYKPLKPIIVDLRAKAVVIKALNKAMKGNNAAAVLKKDGPWKYLLNYRFIRSKQTITTKGHR